MSGLQKRERKQLAKLIERFEELKSQLVSALEPVENDIGDAKSDLTSLHGDIEQRYDGMSDRAQESEKGEAVQSVVNDLEGIDAQLETTLEHCRDAVTEIEAAIEAMLELRDAGE